MSMNEDIRDRVRGTGARQKVTEPMRVAETEEVRTDEDVRERKRKRPGDVDEFWIPPHLIPAGSSYEWKRHSVYGATDPGYDMSLRENGWRPVDVARMPGWMPDGYQGPVIRKGMILMERPMELTEEARIEDGMNARREIRAKEEQMGLTPSESPDLERKVLKSSKSFAPIAGKIVPSD